MSGIRKRSLVIAGHSTSVSLEEPFWQLLQAIATRESISIAALVGRIDNARSGTNLSSAIRLFVLDHVMTAGATK